MRTYFPLKGAVSGYMDNVKTIEAMKADMSRIDTLREAVKTDGIAAPMTESNLENIRDAEGKIMDKAKADNKAKRSMSLAGLGAVIGKVSDASISGMAGIFLEATKWNHIGEGHEDTTPDSVAIGVETRGVGHTSLTIGNKDGSFEEGNYGRYGGNHGSISGRGQTPVGTGTYVIDNNFNPEYSDKIVYILNPVIVSAEGVRNSYNNQFLNANYIRRSLREEESIKLGGGRLINYIYRSVDGMSDYKLVGNNCVSTTMKSIKEGVIEGNLTFQTALTLTALQQAVSPWEVKKF